MKTYKCENCKSELESFVCKSTKTTIDDYNFIENTLDEREVVGSEIDNYFCPNCDFKLNNEKINNFLSKLYEN